MYSFWLAVAAEVAPVEVVNPVVADHPMLHRDLKLNMVFFV